MAEFVALRAKSYAYVQLNNDQFVESKKQKEQRNV